VFPGVFSVLAAEIDLELCEACPFHAGPAFQHETLHLEQIGLQISRLAFLLYDRVVLSLDLR
jgi:hypothetical protein